MLAVGAGACADLPQCAPPREHVVELFSWWVEPGEEEAVNDLIELHTSSQRARGRPTWVNHTTVGSAAQASYYLWERRFPMLKLLPDVFQANVGKELRTHAGTLILPVNAALDTTPGSVFDSSVLEPASVKPYLYCVPLNIHRVNTLFFNRTALEKLGIDVNQLSTLAGFEQVCEAIKSQTQAAPIAIGTRDSAWTLSALVHENILPADVSPDTYRSFWSRSGGTYDWNKLSPSYSRLIRWVRQWVNSDYASVHWKTAAERLLLPDDDAHKAFFFVMGDWAHAEFKSAGSRLKTRDVIDSVPFPGSDAATPPPFVYTADCLALPRTTLHSGDGMELLKTAASPEGQLAFSNKKGSIPARLDISKEAIKRELGDRGARARDQLESAMVSQKLLLAVSGYTTRDELNGLDEQLLLMLEESAKPPNPDNPQGPTEAALKLMFDFWAAKFKKLGVE
ncbi:MAG TPA: ABC transporter substrate-binding protein [Polyangiaceae bacterium]|nr:ABC transporter substrate-binding protein [Polyangiaceae bacterium]